MFLLWEGKSDDTSAFQEVCIRRFHFISASFFIPSSFSFLFFLLKIFILYPFESWIKGAQRECSEKCIPSPEKKLFCVRFHFRFNSRNQDANKIWLLSSPPSTEQESFESILSGFRISSPNHLPFAWASLTSWGAFVSPESVSRTRCFWKSSSLIVFKNVPRISHAEISVTQSLLRDKSEITSSAKVLIFWFCWMKTTCMWKIGNWKRRNKLFKCEFSLRFQ